MSFKTFEDYWEWYKQNPCDRKILTIYEEQIARAAFDAALHVNLRTNDEKV